MTEPRPATRPFELDPTLVEVTLEPPGGLPVAMQPVEAVPVRGPRWRRWLGRVFVVAVGGLLINQAVAYTTDLLATNPALGWPFAILLGAATLAGAGLVIGEYRNLRRLTHRAHLRDAAIRLAGSELHGEAAPVIERIAAEAHRSPAVERGLAEFRARSHEGLNDGELLALFERNALAPLDRHAYRIILQSSRDIGILTALSPLGMLDGVLVIARTLAMMRAIARLYGLAPGPAASLSLLRRSLRNAALAGLADIVAQATLEHAGASLLALFSARAGQGAGNALLSARLGLEAMRLTRPLPFVAEEQPRLSRMRRSLLTAPPPPPAEAP